MVQVSFGGCCFLLLGVAAGGVHQRQLNESLALGGGQGGLLRLLLGFLGGLPLFLGLLGCLLGIRQELHHLRLDLDDLVVGFCHLLGVFRSQGSGGGSLQIGVFSGLPGRLGCLLRLFRSALGCLSGFLCLLGFLGGLLGRIIVLR